MCVAASMFHIEQAKHIILFLLKTMLIAAFQTQMIILGLAYGTKSIFITHMQKACMLFNIDE